MAAATHALQKGAWATMSGRDRGGILLKLADVIKQHEEELALLETLDGGFPVTQSKNLHLADAIAVFRYFGGWADKIQARALPGCTSCSRAPGQGHLAAQPGCSHQAVCVHAARAGGCGGRHHAVELPHRCRPLPARSPISSPSDMMSWKIAPALAAGNTIVHKPAQNTSLTALKVRPARHSSASSHPRRSPNCCATSVACQTAC